MSLADARTVNESVVAAGFGPAYPNVAPVYEFTVPPRMSQKRSPDESNFRTMLPHGEPDGNGA